MNTQKYKSMKHYLILFTALFAFSCSNSNRNTSINNSKASATAQTVNGIYVFVKSKPTSRYDFLGAIELKWYDKLTTLDQQNLESVIHNLTGILSFRDNLVNTINEVKQKYPSADGVIFDDDMGRCEAIKFIE